ARAGGPAILRAMVGRRRGRGVLVAILVPALALTPALLSRSRADAAALPPAFSDPSLREADVARVVSWLERPVVAARLASLGLDPFTVQARLARLSDAELHRLAEAASEAALGGQDPDRPGGTERTLGTILIFLVALVVLGGLIYFAVAGF